MEWLQQQYPIYYPRDNIVINYEQWSNELVIDPRVYSKQEIINNLANLGITDYSDLDDGYQQILKTMPEKSWMKEQIDYLKTLSPPDLELISMYGSGKGSSFMSDYRKGAIADLFPLNAARYKNPSSLQKRLNTLIKKAPVPNRPFNVYRGILPERIHQIPTIISTSADIDISLIYAGMDDNISGFLDIIVVSANTPCLFISPLAYDGDAEFEIIFPSTVSKQKINSYSKEYRHMETNTYHLRTTNYIFY